jgi:beta-galactosidase
VVELGFDPNGNKSHGYKAISHGDGTDVGWYRRSFDLPAPDRGKTVWIEFDGVFRNCLVWLNGHCLGRNVSGYSSFSYDIGQYARFGGQNLLVVRVDASRTEGWFYEGAGIYRHVWLVKTDPVHVAHWGTYVTSAVEGSSGSRRWAAMPIARRTTTRRRSCWRRVTGSACW